MARELWQDDMFQDAYRRRLMTPENPRGEEPAISAASNAYWMRNAGAAVASPAARERIVENDPSFVAYATRVAPEPGPAPSMTTTAPRWWISEDLAQKSPAPAAAAGAQAEAAQAAAPAAGGGAPAAPIVGAAVPAEQQMRPTAAPADDFYARVDRAADMFGIRRTGGAPADPREVAANRAQNEGFGLQARAAAAREVDGLDADWRQASGQASRERVAGMTAEGARAAGDARLSGVLAGVQQRELDSQRDAEMKRREIEQRATEAEKKLAAAEARAAAVRAMAESRLDMQRARSDMKDRDSRERYVQSTLNREYTDGLTKRTLRGYVAETYTADGQLRPGAEQDPEMESLLGDLNNLYRDWYGKPYLGGGAPARPAALQAGAVVDGYRYKGGDPKSPGSWEKV